MCYLAVVLGVDVCSVVVEHLDHIDVSAVGCEPQRRVSLLVLDFYLCSSVQKKLHEPDVAFVGGYSESGVPRGRDWRGVDVSSLVQEDSTDLHVAATGSLHQRSETSLHIAGLVFSI
jgi:hypothetical protein